MINRFYRITWLLAEIVYGGIFFLIPLFFAFFLKTANVFELNKIILFKILLLFLLFLTAFKILFYPDKIWLKRIFRNKSAYIPLAFLVILFFCAFFSKDFETSFYGLYEWQEGLLSYVYFIAWFYLLVINIKSREQVGRIVIAIAFSSFFVCVYGLIQASGHDFLNWNESTGLRIISTFGQPNFLASYLLLVMPVSVYLIFTSRRLFFKFFGFSYY